jgi:hypothetical protein
VDATPGANAPTSDAKAGTRRRRGVLSGLALILACLTIVVATSAVWVHQVALNTDRFTALVTDVVAKPEVIDPVAAAVSNKVVTALDLETRIADRLPDLAKPLARPMTLAVQQAIEKRLQTALANPKVQTALLKTLSFAHEHLVALLRGQGEAITTSNGYVQLNVFPVIGIALNELQSIGLIPATVVLPDLSADEAPAALAARLESALGITLPADFGTIQLMPADRLTTAQTVVKVFDIVVVVLILLSFLLALLAIWLAQRRLRMVVYLGIGTIVALVIARFVVRGIASALLGGIEDQGIAGAVTAVVEATVADLVGFITIVLVVAAAVCVVAYVAGRPAWLVRLTSRSAEALSATAPATAGAATDAGTGRDLGPVIRQNRSAVERFGIAAIVFAVVWIALGLGIALLGLALVGAWLLIVRIVATDPDAAAADGPPDPVPPTTPEPGTSSLPPS